MTKPVLYNIVCGYCKQPYDYRVYQNSKEVTKQDIKPDVDSLDMLISHGICNNCIKQVYEDNKLEEAYDQLEMSKRW